MFVSTIQQLFTDIQKGEKMKQKRHKMIEWAMAGIVLTGAGIGIIACQSHKNCFGKLHQVNTYPYYEATIEDIPPLDRVKGIMIMDYYHPEMAEIVMLIGNQVLIEEIIGREIFPTQIVADEKWIQQITSHFKNAERNKHVMACLDTRVAFITNHGAYMVMFSESTILTEDEEMKVIYGPGYYSGQLFQDFCEVGLINKHSPDSDKPPFPFHLYLRGPDPNIPQYEPDKSGEEPETFGNFHSGL
jgi:hypothetical protein